jgi:solute carrier family 25 carnitine/acylcarnitine transporter 20/29
MMAYPYPKPYPSPSSNVFTRPSFIAVVRRTYSIDGVAGFYKGLTPTILRAFPVNASALFVYEGVMRLLGAEEVSSSL